MGLARDMENLPSSGSAKLPSSSRKINYTASILLLVYL